VERRTGVGRYYDPSTAQFLSVDPKVMETGQPYAFTGDDPLNATDPLGLSSVYFLLNRFGHVYYVGRSKRTPTREQEHAASGKIASGSSMRVLDTENLSKTQAAGTEQLLIETFGMRKNGGVLSNRRNEVANPSKSANYTYDSATVAGATVFRNNVDALKQTEGLAVATADPQVMNNFIILKIMSMIAVPGESGSQLQRGVAGGLADGHL
jgi:hypothetical protein